MTDIGWFRDMLRESAASKRERKHGCAADEYFTYFHRVFLPHVVSGLFM